MYLRTELSLGLFIISSFQIRGAGKLQVIHKLNDCSYRGADKSLARPISRCILSDGEKISFDSSLVMYTNSTNIPPIMIINRIYENQNLLSLYLVYFLVGLRTYQHSCICEISLCGSHCEQQSCVMMFYYVSWKKKRRKTNWLYPEWLWIIYLQMFKGKKTCWC